MAYYTPDRTRRVPRTDTCPRYPVRDFHRYKHVYTRRKYTNTLPYRVLVQLLKKKCEVIAEDIPASNLGLSQ